MAPPSPIKPKIQQLAEAIGQYEGFFVTQAQAQHRGIHWPTIPQRMHNPGDLMFVDQPGAKDHPVTGSDGKVRHYAEFADDAAGWAALEKQIRLDASRGLTLWQFVQKYAPSADSNDPESYFAFVAKQLGAAPTDLLAAVISDDPGEGTTNAG